MKRKSISETSAESVQPDAAGTTSSGEYDVFLNFRGIDTRYSFVDCLYEFLTEAGIRVFMDDEALHIGDDIGDKLRTAIDSSRLYIPIFSRNYASSKWCLIELAQMVKRAQKSYGKEILPVFFDVEPEDVKLKTELYAEDLLRHEESLGSHKVRKWRKALGKVSKMKGWNLQSNQGQGKLIRQIAGNISHRLEIKHRILPDHFIGIEEQVQDIMDALDFGSRDARFVVIHGMGGIGKTTLASAVFNKICWQFQGCSFLSNVRESAAGNGILNLQNKLMRDILRFSSFNFCDENDAMNCIQGSLRNKDVLVVLDDVSDMDQIKKLVGMGDWVGLGSRVMITTRNLSCVANVKEIENKTAILRGKKISIYQMKELGFDLSLQLLCRHAFGQHMPPHGYKQLTREVISFTRGVPLAIEVIGSYLGWKGAGIWKEMLNKLKKVPHEGLYREILMSSYEALCNEEKVIFLDIAFFFSGHDKTSAFYYWDACGLFPEISVDTLVSYALVKIDGSNEILMHDLLKDLGREVVRKQSNGNLGMYSRLCNEDAKRLLLKRELTKHVKALKFDSTHAYNFTPTELSGLSGLRFLELCGGNFVGDFEGCGLSELRWLSWRDCALDFLGTNFYLENLVVLKLSRSSITDSWSRWEQFKMARNLKVLELESLNLTTLTLSTFSSLERLMIRECDFLDHIDLSIGNPESLYSLELISQSGQVVFQLPSSTGNVRALSCLLFHHIKLNQLPENIGELKGLKVMKVTGCEFLRTLPDSIGDLDSLIDLDLSDDGITELPESIGKLRNLIKLDVSKNRLRSLPATIGDLDKLEVLDASHNEELKGEIPDEFGKLQSLRYLELSWTRICGLPSSSVQLSRLESLKLENCPELHGLPDLPKCLTDLVISSTTHFAKSKDLTAERSPMRPPYSSTEFVHIDPSISSLEGVNSVISLHLSRTGIFGLPSTMVQLASLKSLSLKSCHEIQDLPELPTSLTDLQISSWSLKAVPNLSSLTNLVDLSLLNCGNHDDYGHNHQVPPYSCAGLDQLSRLRRLHLSCPNPSLLSLLPPGLVELSLYHSTSLSCWESLSYLGCLSNLRLHESIASEIQLDGLESLMNLTYLEIAKCEFLERVYDVSRLQKLQYLHLSNCPKLVEIGAQPPESLQYVNILSCNSIDVCVVF